MKRLDRMILSLGVCALLSPAAVAASPESQWRGANRDGIYEETGLLKQWPDSGPPLAWSLDGLGAGFSSVAVTDSMLYVTGTRDSTDYLSALSVDGQLQWQVPFGKAWETSRPGARSTPTVADGKVYVISGKGDVARIDAASGHLDWRRDAYTEFGGKQGRWGTSEAPLLVGNTVIYTPCGDRTTMVALDRATGRTVWESESLNDQSAYVSPILIDYAGKQMIIGVSGDYIFGVNPKDGSFFWTFAYRDQERPKGGHSINAVSPLYHDGQIYVTSGYNHVGVMLTLSKDGTDVELAWSDQTLDCHHGGVVRVGDQIYGSNWINNGKGNWCAIDWATGKKQYETDWISKGSIIYADGMLYCYSERRGYFALVPADPTGFNVVSSFQIMLGEGEHWSHPVIQDGIMYVRHGGTVMAYGIGQP